MASGDFHTHSTHSDGKKTTGELAALAARAGLRAIALTDHDSTAGVRDMAAALKSHGIRLVPGVELSTDIPGSEVHVLGYFMDIDDRAFQAELARFREGRLGRGLRMIEKLRALGMDVSWERVQEIAGDASVGRPHVAQHLVERGYVESIPEAFDRFIGRNGPAYAEREKLTPTEAVQMIRKAGGLPVVAHPHYTPNAEAILAELAGQGLGGMEVYYKDLGPEKVAELLAIATRLRLLPTGGSDYHALKNPGEREPGDIPLPDEAVEALLAAGEGCACPVVVVS
ncbi:MAG TPA: PHP domain-containing protein [Dehalococcoidia bacterium]|nr:PHP domain-containing protein [Dehalococcoidia bacterium]